jgi:hypothetical protein
MATSGFNLQLMRATLLTICEEVSGISEARPVGSRAVTEEESSWVAPDPDTQATLRVGIFGVQANGGTEFRADDDRAGEPNNVTGTTCANRIITFTIKVEVQRSEFLAFEYVERMRSHIERADILARLAAVGLTLNNTKGSYNTSFTREGRRTSAAGFDIVFNTVTNLVSEPAPLIKTATVTGVAHGTQ